MGKSSLGVRRAWLTMLQIRRYDAFPSLNLFVIRMSTILHEIFIGGVVAELKQQLGDVKGEAASFAGKIISCRSASIHPRDNTYGRHDPDGQF